MSVPVLLNGGRVTPGFRSALFDAAGRAGLSVNEFVLRAAAWKLRHDGVSLTGLFFPGDLEGSNDNVSARSDFAGGIDRFTGCPQPAAP